MHAVHGLIALWLVFAATHLGLSSARLRPRLVSALGERAFLGLYSAIALASFFPLVWLYFENKHAGPFLWFLGGVPGLRWAMYAGMGLALALVLAGVLNPSPASIAPGKAEVRGIYRVTRHPLFMGVGLMGLLHLLVARIHAADLVFFGGLAAFTLIGCLHQDRRKLAGGAPGFAEFHARSGFLPFARRGALEGLAEAPLPVALGIAAAALLRFFHPQLFG